MNTFAEGLRTAGLTVRDRCFANNIVMRHVGDRYFDRAPTKVLDEAYAWRKGEDLLKPPS